VITAIIAYNEARTLPMCLGHLPKQRTIVIDGAFADYPHDVPWSTDGTIDIARRWGAEVIEVTEPWPDQCAKRTLQLIPNEVVFCPDADEMLHTAPPVLPDDADVGWVTCTSPIYRTPFLTPRVYRVREGWHFAGRHHWIYDADGDLVTSHTHPGTKYKHAILPVFISNERDMRESVRNDEKTSYLAKRHPSEMAFDSEESVYARTP